MTEENNIFREAADNLNPTPKKSSWGKLESMLDNKPIVGHENAFQTAADKIEATPLNSSWDRLETMLDNKSLAEENKSYKKLFGLLSGMTALILIGASIVFFNNSKDDLNSNQQFAYQTEPLENLDKGNEQLYDIEKLSKLNDPSLWSNITEGSSNLKVNQVYEN